MIRPHFLINDVSTIDTSITLFGKLSPTDLPVDNGRQELLFPQWRTGNRSGASDLQLHDDYRRVASAFSRLVRGGLLLLSSPSQRAPINRPRSLIVACLL